MSGSVVSVDEIRAVRERRAREATDRDREVIKALVWRFYLTLLAGDDPRIDELEPAGIGECPDCGPNHQAQLYAYGATRVCGRHAGLRLAARDRLERDAAA